jgi:hypothetical protein
MKTKLMKSLNAIVVAAAGLLIGGCKYPSSLSPFCAESDVLLDERLLGDWEKRKPDVSGVSERWVFDRRRGDQGKENVYRLTISFTEGMQHLQHLFEARLFKLKGDSFLDIVPMGDSPSDSEAIEMDLANQVPPKEFAMIRGHVLFRVKQCEPELQIALLDSKWLLEHLEAHPEALAHHKQASERVVLTADTGALQRFVSEHLGEGELFQKPALVMMRRSATKP